MSTHPLSLTSCAAPPRALEEGDVGGKAWNLFRLRENGFDVPPWVVVPVEFFSDAIGQTKDLCDSQLNSCDFEDQRSVVSASRRIRALVEKACRRTL